MADLKKNKKFDARPDTLDFRDQMFVPSLINVPIAISPDRLPANVPVLDQGAEGACTGYGLATVANALLSRHLGERFTRDDHVSPRMFYFLARRYDEWPGEAYEGSSARGAMKGWHKHGVCTESAWPSMTAQDEDYGMTEERSQAAMRNPLGAYFRVNHRDIVAMHVALAEVGVLYASATVHQGWDQVGDDGTIPFSEDVCGGHAFAIIGYDADGFWIQNSWGPGWGRKGRARISYDDWLANGTDAWVAQLGVAINLKQPASHAIAHARSSHMSQAYSIAQLRPHIVNLGNDGELDAGGEYGTTPTELKGIFEKILPPLLDNGKIKHLMLFAHGGLASGDSAVQRVAEYRDLMLDRGIYPLFFIWHSDYLSSVENVLADVLRRARPEGMLDGAKDFMLDRLDDFLEPVARQLTGKLLWDEMKENAERASNAKGGAYAVAGHVRRLKKKYGDVKVHLVGHSAGSVLHAGLAKNLVAPQMGANDAAPVLVDTCTLWAPACTMELFEASYAKYIKDQVIKRFTLFTLDDQAEQRDDCKKIYHKSLLYLVSHAFEKQARNPIQCPNGQPLLGLQRDLANAPAWKSLLDAGRVEWVVCPNTEPKGTQTASRCRHHGDFDNDEETVLATVARMLDVAMVETEAVL
jgi:predicted alpha/beta hydrolase family esterase